MQIKTGIGFCSNLDDAFTAGCDAAGMAMKALGDESPALIIVFTTPQYDLPELLRGIRTVTGSTPLFGGTGSGQIMDGAHSGFGGGVSILALTSGPYTFGLASTRDIKGKLDETGQELARKSRKQAGSGEHEAILLMVDCLAGDLQEIINGVYRVTGPKVLISGGAAGDELQFKTTYVFHNDQVIPSGAVALWINSPKPLKIVTRHGFKPIGIPMLVTKAEGTEIFELGGGPAATAYEEQLGFSPGELTEDNFWNTSVRHPLGLMQPDGTNVIRVARSKTPDGALRIQGCIPPVGSAVQVMTCTTDDLLEVCNEVADAFSGDDDISLLLVFSCAARATIFGIRTFEEAERLKRSAGDKSVFGIYCCGELARTAGLLGTHNATLTALAL